MLPLEYRLKNRTDFAKAFTEGKYASFGEISIKYAKNSLANSRIGFPVGKNYSKKAVVRNRTRRILQTACGEQISKLKPSFDIIVLIRPTYQDIELKKAANELDRVFAKANLFI